MARIMRITKLIVGILMIVFGIWLFVQAITSGFLGLSNYKNIAGGVIGILLSMLFLAGGIIYISTERITSLGGDIACLVLMIIAGVLGFAGGLYNALLLDGIIALIIGFGFFIWHIALRNA